MPTRNSNNGVTHTTPSDGNVFADLGLDNPEEELLKSGLLLQIYTNIKERKLTQAQAGEILGIKQPHVSNIMNGRSGSWSVGRLMKFLKALGNDIDVTVKPKPRHRAGQLRFKTASAGRLTR